MFLLLHKNDMDVINTVLPTCDLVICVIQFLKVINEL